MSLSKFESMLKTNNIFFFDLVEFEEIILHYLDKGKHSLATKAVKLGLEQHPTSIDLKLLQVELLIFQNELDEASIILNKLEHLAPSNEEVFIQKATILSKKGKHQEAIQNLNLALSNTNDAVDIWSLIGMEYLYLDDFDNARLNFAKCIDVDYEDYSSLYNIVYCFDMQKDHEQAIRYLNTYIDKNPYCEVAWHQLGRQYYTLNMFKEALIAFDYAIIIDENFIGGYLEKAKTLEELGRFQEAISNYLHTLDLDDPTAYAYTRIGECYQHLEDLDTALEYYKKAVHEDPLLDKGWLLLTNIYFLKEDYEKALYYINKALKIDDSNPLYWRKYSNVNLKLNFLEESVVGYNNCLQLNDIDIDIFIAKSDALNYLGELTKSLNVLLEAQKIYKDFAEIEYRLACLSMSLKNEPNAFRHLENALKINSEYVITMKQLYPRIFKIPSFDSLIISYIKVNK